MFTKVENKNPYLTAKEYYWHTTHDGIDYLFTESQCRIASDRALNNPEDIPVFTESPKPDIRYSLAIAYCLGFITSAVLTTVTYFIVKQFI